MNTLLLSILGHKRAVMFGGVFVTVALGSFGFLHHTRPDDESIQRPRLALFADVKRVVSGQRIKIDDKEPFVYAAIRAPHGNEPLYKEARRRNAELIEDKRIRLRFDQDKHDRKGRLMGYAFVDHQFVNEILVREGLAYVRLTPKTRRFSDRLLTAQADARRHRRGVWNKRWTKQESSYPADPKYGTFHRPSCSRVKNIKPERLMILTSRKQAFLEGYAPCGFCNP